MKKIFFLLFFIILIFISKYKGIDIGQKKERNNYNELDKIIENSFQLGCETASLRKCSIKDQNECRKFCFVFIKENPQLLDVLKKKAKEVIINTN